jgi:peptidoglycan hydrolase-like protein with peptidoglycan-binding domain
MNSLTFYDASTPPAHPPAGADGVCGYIGGDTPYIWSLADWNSQSARYRLPIFTRSDPPGPGAQADVTAALDQLHVIGAPKGCLVAWDFESAVNAGYTQQVYSLLHQANYVLMAYGSVSSVFGNKDPDGYYWGAQWTGVQHFANGADMTQWVSFSAYDMDVALSDLPFWDTHATNPPPPPPPHPGVSWADITIKVPVLQVTNPYTTDRPGWRFVARLQAACTALGVPITIDGVFGPLTEASLKTIQRQFGITQDGIAGPKTWGCLDAGQPA